MKTCRTSDVKIDHGSLSEPRYTTTTTDEQKIFTENETAKFSCERHYKLEGNGELKCMESGLWSDKAPRCGMWENKCVFDYFMKYFDCEYMKIIYVNCKLRNEFESYPRSYERYLSNSENKGFRKFRPVGDFFLGFFFFTAA